MFDEFTPIQPGEWLLEMPVGRVEWSEVFGNLRPVELEVGSGKGLFLANAGERHPERNFFGIEVSRKYARRAAERIAKKRLANVRVLRGGAREFLAEHVAPESLAALHLYFPDPWWKQRHKKRRVFCDSFLDDVTRVLRPGSDFLIATDVEEYYTLMTRLLAERPLFEPLPAPVASLPEHDLDYLTSFERKYRLQGRAIFRAHYRRI
jgi:tRNA (guanine-N7-)-methyltransferase